MTSLNLCTFPEEILTSITEELVVTQDPYQEIKYPYSKHQFSPLKSLRLTCSRFAYLPLVQKTLFGDIQLVASPKGLDRLARTDIGRLVPFAKQVSFVAPIQSWALGYDIFREIVISEAIWKQVRERGFVTTGEEAAIFPFDIRNGYQVFIDQVWDGRVPFTEDQIRAGFAEYQREARAVKDTVLGEQLKTKWASILRALHNVCSIRFIHEGHLEVSIAHPPTQPPCVVQVHSHDECHRDEPCIRAAAPLGDALFAAGVVALAAADVKIRNLQVACAMTGRFEWDTLPEWSRPNLTEVRKFYFMPEVHWIEADRDTIGSHRHAAGRAAEAIAAVLNKCADHLEEFYYGDFLRLGRFCDIHWPGEEIIALPRLTRLRLGAGGVRTRNLSLWMEAMPSLQHLRLDYPMRGDVWYGWKYVFDAVRNHPKGMKIDFEYIEGNHGAGVSVHYHTDDFQRYLNKEEAKSISDGIDRDMALYMSGTIGYNERLRKWFGTA